MRFLEDPSMRFPEETPWSVSSIHRGKACMRFLEQPRTREPTRARFLWYGDGEGD